MSGTEYRQESPDLVSSSGSCNEQNSFEIVRRLGDQEYASPAEAVSPQSVSTTSAGSRGQCVKVE